jgi:hypothetical protein
VSLESLVEHKLDNQMFQISFIWIEENSYYSSTEVLQTVHRSATKGPQDNTKRKKEEKTIAKEVK